MLFHMHFGGWYATPMADSLFLYILKELHPKFVF